MRNRLPSAKALKAVIVTGLLSLALSLAWRALKIFPCLPMFTLMG
jgi:hypothetical protein